MKGLILAGGASKRFGLGDKCFNMVNQKPLVEHSLDRMAELDLDEILIVWGNHRSASLYGDYYKDIPLTQFVQFQPTGTIDAIILASEELFDDFYLMMGDEIMINSRHTEMLKQFKGSTAYGLCGFCLVRDINEIRKTYSLKIDTEWNISKFEEKPQVPINHLMGTGNCILDESVLDCLEETPINAQRKERELVDWLQIVIDQGKIIKAFDVCNEYININTLEDLQLARKKFGE